MFEINICFTYIYVLMKCWFTINSYTYYDYISVYSARLMI